MNNGDIKDFNVNEGEYSYAGPLTRLFCIYYHNTDFQQVQKSVSNVDSTGLKASAVTFATKLFTSVVSTTDTYYSFLDPLKALYTLDSQTSEMYFPIPKPNFSGMCNYNKPAIFLQEEDSE